MHVSVHCVVSSYVEVETAPPPIWWANPNSPHGGQWNAVCLLFHRHNLTASFPYPSITTKPPLWFGVFVCGCVRSVPKHKALFETIMPECNTIISIGSNVFLRTRYAHPPSVLGALVLQHVLPCSRDECGEILYIVQFVRVFIPSYPSHRGQTQCPINDGVDARPGGCRVDWTETKARAASEAAAAAAAVMQINEQKVNQFHSPHHGQQAYGRKSRETNTAALEKQPGVDL